MPEDIQLNMNKIKMFNNVIFQCFYYGLNNVMTRKNTKFTKLFLGGVSGEYFRFSNFTKADMQLHIFSIIIIV